MRDAFAYNQAAVDTLNYLANTDPSNDPSYLAKIDLLQYMFKNTMSNPPTVVESDAMFQHVLSVFTAVQLFNQKGDGTYSVRPQGTLPSDDVIVYCDYSRFQEGRQCDNRVNSSTACDRDTGLTVDMDKNYKGCKSHAMNIATVRVKCLHSYVARGLTLHYLQAWTLDNNNEGKIAQIQMCSWYLRYTHVKSRQSVVSVQNNSHGCGIIT